MPWTGLFFLVGAMAISGLPLLNGFASEWLTFQALLLGFASTPGLVRLNFPLGGAMLALTTRAGGGVLREGVRHQFPGVAAEPGGGRGARVAGGDARAAGVSGGAVRRRWACSRASCCARSSGVHGVVARTAAARPTWRGAGWGWRPRVGVVRSRRARRCSAWRCSAAVVVGERARGADAARRVGGCRRGAAAAS